MNSEIRNCQNCKKDFIIEPDDFSFYEKIKVPPPTFCPECRQQRRYSWRNERTLYRRNCDLCGNNIVTIYSPNKNLKVYCPSCWWSDKWDASIYEKDFDFSKSFFEQYRELQKEVPRLSLFSTNCINSDYVNHSINNKNAYLTFSCANSSDILYSSYIMQSVNCVDCSYIYDCGEKCYECINSSKIYKCQQSLMLKNCLNCFYCYDCRNCSDCFMSSNLRNKKFVFKNKQLTKEEYEKSLKNNDLSSFKERKKMDTDFINLIKEKSIHKYFIGENNINFTGNSLYNSKDAKNCFDSGELENCKNCFGCEKGIKDSMDLYHVGFNIELSYECQACTGLSNSSFCHLCYSDQSIQYCDSCHNSNNLFGCISIKKGDYMILNKKYSKDEYKELKNKIIEHMKKLGEYGEFFPANIAPICYNESQANYYIPLTKEEVISNGYLWEDKVPGVFGRETLFLENISDNINEIKENITKEILKCTDCTKNYNITNEELSFYKQEEIPIPRLCPDCRYKKRFSFRLPRKLWHRHCMKHGCTNEFKTSYSPDRPEIVYCEKCYQGEVY